MEKVVEAMSSGDVVFPGTNMVTVKAYLSRFDEVPKPKKPKRKSCIIEEGDSSAILASLDESSPSKDTVNTLIQLLKANADATLTFILKICQNEEWIHVIDGTQLVGNLLMIIQETTNAQEFGKILKIITFFISHNSLQADAVPIIIDAFSRIGNTSMVEIPSIIYYGLTKGCNLNLTDNIITRLSAFLQSSDMVSRHYTTNLFSILLQNNFNPRSYAPLVSPAITNLQPQRLSQSVVKDSDLLAITVNLLYRLVFVGKLVQEFIEGGGIVAIIQCLAPTSEQTTAGNRDIRSALLQIMSVSCRGDISSECVERIADALQSLSALVPSEDQQGDELARLLSALAFAFNRDVSKIALEKYRKFVVQCFESCPNIRTVLVALKIAYHYLSDASTRDLFVCTTYTRLLQPLSPPIAIMACNCLLHILPNVKSDEDYIAFFDRYVFDFLQTALSSVSDLTVPALRLFGVLALSPLGAKTLEQNKFPIQVGGCMCTNIFSVKYNGFKAFAAFASTFPISESAVAATIPAMQALTDPKLAPYPLVVLSNVIVCPAAAVTVAKNVAYLVSQIQSADVDQMRLTIATLTKVFSTLEAREYFTDVPTLRSLFEAAQAYVDTPSWWSLVELIDIATGTNPGLEAVREVQNTLLPILNRYLTKKISKKNRWHINRIFIRLGVQN